MNRASLVLAIALGASLVGFIGYAFTRLGRDATTGNRAMEGIIVRREFTPAAPEEQVTFGRGGLSTRRTNGEHLLVVRAADGREYRVPVDETTFAARREGERFLFLRQ